MSSYKTHALIGAVGGLIAYKVAEPSMLIARHDKLPAAFVCIAVSAVLALWPDIDQPGSWMANRTRWFIPPITVALLLAGFSGVEQPPPMMFTIGFGALIGLVIAPSVPDLVNRVSGGHRHLTHSLVLLAGLAGLGWLAHGSAMVFWAAPLLLLAWGEALHLIGDVVTPGGVALFHPLKQGEVHILPEQISRFGEPLIALVSLIVCVFILRR